MLQNQRQKACLKKSMGDRLLQESDADGKLKSSARVTESFPCDPPALQVEIIRPRYRIGSKKHTRVL
ncbi:hypothetical protein [Phormidesmis priestleyi]